MAKKAPVQAIEDDDDVELEEVEDVEEAPAKAVAPEIWGVRSLIALIEEKTGKEYKPREVRTLLRKLAREGGGVDREIIPGNKSRYEWSGPGDPEVKAILKAVKGGEIEAAKTAALNKLKSDKAARTAAKGDAAPAKKKKAAPPADDDDDDDDDD